MHSYSIAVIQCKITHLRTQMLLHLMWVAFIGVHLLFLEQLRKPETVTIDVRKRHSVGLPAKENSRAPKNRISC